MSEEGKIAAGKRAVELIKNGMIIGLGSGTTSAKFIESLIIKTQKGLQIKAVASSRKSAELAKRGGIEVVDINSVPRIDITVDGADEIDPQKRMIKGGGGAHVREKILATSSSEMVVVIDESKFVEALGCQKLPIEVMFYGFPATRMKIDQLGYTSNWRLNEDGTFFITENGNLILDLHFGAPLRAPEPLHEIILTIPGVIDTGFFFNIASKIVIGFNNGTSKIRE